MTEQAKFIEVLEGFIDVFKTGYELGHNDTVESCYTDAEERGRDCLEEIIEGSPNLQYAITACKAMESAGEVLPKMEAVKGCYIDKVVAQTRNLTLDEMRPAFGRILHENNELKADIRKDWIENVKPMRAENAKLIQENKDMKAEIKLHEKSLGETLDREYDLKAEGTKLEEQVEISNKIISNYYNETKDLKAECERLRDELHKATHIKLHPIDNIMGKKGNTTRMKGEQT